MSQISWIENVRSCLRGVGEKNRIFPNGKKLEVVFAIKAVNFLLLRTEGPGDINEATLPESRLSVPVIQPQKLMAVVRRRMLQALRMYRDAGVDLKPYIEKAKELGFIKAREHLSSGWNCSIQPPLAQAGEKMTDIGMDGYCPACTIFGAALTEAQYEKAGGTMSVGIKTRVHFDPAFATTRAVQPETHNKVTEGAISTTGGALFSEVHVMPGTLFIGRAVLYDVTEPELLGVLYSLATTEEIGGRSGVYGTIKVELLGIRCGDYSITTALELADEIASNDIKKPSDVIDYISSKLGVCNTSEESTKEGKKTEKLGFTKITNKGIIDHVNPMDREGIFRDLWNSSIDYVVQMDNLIQTFQSKESSKSGGRRKE